MRFLKDIEWFYVSKDLPSSGLNFPPIRKAPRINTPTPIRPWGIRGTVLALKLAQSFAFHDLLSMED
jgi:hypothetical protein